MASTPRLSKSVPKRQCLSLQTPEAKDTQGNPDLPTRGSHGISYLVDRLDAEDDADWCSLVASAAASMSTSLRERGTFSAFRDFFISSRPFKLSERPSLTSARELRRGDKAEKGMSVLGQAGMSPWL